MGAHQKNQATLRITEDNGFLIQYLFPDESHHYSWDMHNGLAGHLAYSQRRERHEVLRAIIAKKLREAFSSVEKKRCAEMLFFVMSNLRNDLAGARSWKLHNLLNNNILKYYLISGFSRSGGTYLLSEYAKQNELDIQDKHFYWSHDFYPSFSVKDYRSDIHVDTNTLLYYSTLISHMILNQETTFFKRTTLGAVVARHLEKLSLGINVELVWRHGIRDLHGIYRSLEKMYTGYREATGSDFYRVMLGSYGILGECPSKFGTYAAGWFASNLSILPVQRDLPFYDKHIDMSEAPEHIIVKVNHCVDEYLRKYQKNIFDLRFKPVVIKYGQDFISQCEMDAAQNKVSGYIPATLNYSACTEIDDPYTPVYECFLHNVTRLYQHFDIAFDGKLDRF